MTAYATGPGEGEVLAAGPSHNRVRVPGDATGGRLSVIEMRIDGGWGGPPPHVHDEVEHVWFVLDGEVELTIGDRVERYGEGSCVFVPAGVPHTFSTSTGGAVRILEIDSPRPLDGYFRDLAAAFPAGRPPDPEAVRAIMRRHDTRAVSP